MGREAWQFFVEHAIYEAVLRYFFMLLIVVVACLSCADSLPERLSADVPKVVVRDSDSLFVKKFGVARYDGELFAGTAVTHHPDGWQMSETQYLQGIRHGREVLFYADGATRSIKYFDQGRKVAVHYGWWPNGQERFEYGFRDGVRHGDYVEWYPNGQQCLDYYYEDGTQVGAQQGWRENGKLYINYVVKQGRKYGLVNQRLCFSLGYEAGEFVVRKTKTQ